MAWYLVKHRATLPFTEHKLIVELRLNILPSSCGKLPLSMSFIHVYFQMRHVLVFWVMIPCSNVAGYPEHEVSMALPNVGIQPHHCTVSQPRRPRH